MNRSPPRPSRIKMRRLLTLHQLWLTGSHSQEIARGTSYVFRAYKQQFMVDEPSSWTPSDSHRRPADSAMVSLFAKTNTKRSMMARERTALPESDPSAPQAHGSLSHRARRAAMWTGGSAILVRLSNVLVMAVVARIIAPDELGVYALAITVHGFVVCLASWGVTSAIARADLDADKLGPTVTTVALLSSGMVAGLMAITAGPVASAFHAPEAAGPIRILAIAVVLQAVFAVPASQLQREFRQEVMFRASAVSFVTSSASLLLLATVMHGAEAFAWSRVVGTLTVGVVIVRALHSLYRPGWNVAFIGPLLRFGMPAALGSLLSQLVLNVDYVIIGREMSTTDLGLYMLAFNICSWPTAALGAVMDQVVLPAFSGVRRAGGDLRSTVSRAVRTVALIACPISAFTMAFSHPLIEAVYGSRWLSAAPLLRVLAVYGVLYVIGMLFSNIMIASGRTLAMLAVQAVALIALVPALIVGVRTGGLVGVGIGHIVVVLLVTMPAYAVAMKFTADAGVLDMVRALSRPVVAAAAAAGAALVVTASSSHPVITLAMGGVVGLIVYMAVAGPELLRLLPARLADKRILVLFTTWPVLSVRRLRRIGRHD
jgi:lipopolysaccharide exporter